MSEIPRQNDPGRISIRALLAVAALYLAVTLPFLGGPPLFDPDEGYYPATASEMISRGDWLDPVFNAAPRWGKPVAFYLADVISLSAFGHNEFAARLPSALAGLGLTIVTALTGAALFGTGTGVLSGILCATAVQTAVYSRSAVPDMFLAFFVALSLLAFLRAYRDRETPGGAWLWTMYAASGLAFLSKGPLGAILPAIAIGAYLAATRQWKGFIAIKPVRGVLLFLAVAAPWYAYMYHLHGIEFLHEHFIGRNLERYFTNRWEHAGPLWYYMPVLIAGTFPWTIAFAGGAVSSVRKALTKTDSANEQKFLLCWLIGMLVFFSFSRSKLPNYILPLYPAALIIAARLLHGLAERGAHRQILWLARGTSAATVILVVVGISVLSRKLGEPKGEILLWLSPLVLMAIAAGLAQFRWAGIRALTWGGAAAMALFFAVLTGVAIPRVERLQAVRRLAEDCRGQLPPDATVASWRVWNPSFLFYTGATVYRFNPESESWPPPGADRIEWVLTRSSSIDEVVQRTGRQLAEVHQRDRYVLLRLAGE